MNFQSVSWFWDLYQRHMLELDPPYQRRSVWNQEYKDYFVDTVLNSYPAPAIFLYEEMTPEGVAKYAVVDGKQRLSTLFEFAQNRFPVSDEASISKLRGKYFKDLESEVKTSFWKYQFAVEYLPSSDEKIINNVFDRLNRNVAKLTPQELRHARFSGEFITEAESLTDIMFTALPQNFPNIAQRSKKQMKDVELVAQLLLLLEEGPRSYSQDSLDQAFSDRDESWQRKEEIVFQFRNVVEKISALTKEDMQIASTRLKNQADFYSLFGAIHETLQADQEFPSGTAGRMVSFAQVVEASEKPASQLESTEYYKAASAYYEAARSASNDASPRRVRIDIIKMIISGQLRLEE